MATFEKLTKEMTWQLSVHSRIGKIEQTNKLALVLLILGFQFPRNFSFAHFFLKHVSRPVYFKLALKRFKMLCSKSSLIRFSKLQLGQQQWLRYSRNAFSVTVVDNFSSQCFTVQQQMCMDAEIKAPSAENQDCQMPPPPSPTPFFVSLFSVFGCVSLVLF